MYSTHNSSLQAMSERERYQPRQRAAMRRYFLRQIRPDRAPRVLSKSLEFVTRKLKSTRLILPGGRRVIGQLE